MKKKNASSKEKEKAKKRIRKLLRQNVVTTTVVALDSGSTVITIGSAIDGNTLEVLPNGRLFVKR